MDMFRSLRFRLPAFFLAGAVLAGLISTLIALGLFQDYTEDRLVAESAGRRAGCRRSTPSRRSAHRTLTGAYYVSSVAARAGEREQALLHRPQDRLPRNDRACRRCPLRHGRVEGRQAEGVRVHAAQREPRVPGSSRIRFEWTAVSTARWSWRSRRPSYASGWTTLIERLALAGSLRDRRRRGAWPGTCPVESRSPSSSSRRRPTRSPAACTRSRSRDQGERRDRPARGALREMAARLAGGGGARAQLPDDGLARAADAADGDPRPCRGAPRGRRTGRGEPRASRST